MHYPVIRLKKDRERSVLQRHPWLFSGAVEHVDSNLKNGDIARIQSNNGKFLAIAHYFNSSITARILSFEPVEINQSFFEKRLIRSFEYRKQTGLPSAGTNLFRLIHGEGDFLPGLIVDIYGNTAVMQCHTEGMLQSAGVIAQALLMVSPIKLNTVFLKGVNKDKPDAGQYLHGNQSGDICIENGIKFRIDWEAGQKTGFFIDQRENRKLLQHYCHGKKVLNLFAYTGGFSLYALKGGACRVTSVDSSAPACELNRENTRLNFETEAHTVHCSDVFDYMKTTDEEFDIIVVDPPAFAKQLSAAGRASVRYRTLNAGVMKKLRGGIMFTFSCSQAISMMQFRKIIFQAALESGRQVQILHTLGQSPDHPVNICHPEGEYLKGLVLYVGSD